MSLKMFQRYVDLLMVFCMVYTVVEWRDGNYGMAGALGAVSLLLLLIALAAINMENRQ